jgi:hypothetical protein
MREIYKINGSEHGKVLAPLIMFGALISANPSYAEQFSPPKSQECTSQETVVFVKGGKEYTKTSKTHLFGMGYGKDAMVNLDIEEKEAVKGGSKKESTLHIISDKGTGYIWKDPNPKKIGVTFDFKMRSPEDTAGVKAGNLKCKPWTYNDTKFAPPGDIMFIKDIRSK